MRKEGQKDRIVRLKVLALVLIIATPFLVAATKLVGGFVNIRVIQKIAETRKLIEAPRSYRTLFTEWQFQKPETTVSMSRGQIRSGKDGRDFFGPARIEPYGQFLPQYFIFDAIARSVLVQANQFFASVYSWTRPPTA